MTRKDDQAFNSAIRAKVRLKLAESKWKINSGAWVERERGIAAASGIKRDVGNAFEPPASMGQCRPYFPPEQHDSEEYERVNAAIDKERDDWWEKCEAFDRIAERITLPPLPEDRPSLNPELAEVDAKLADDPTNVTIQGLRCYVLEQGEKLKRRVDGTLPREYLEQVVQLINLEVEKLTGIPQTAVLPEIQNDATWVRRMGARADV